MNSSNMKDNIFPLSEAGNARIEFKTYRFLLHSHKEGIKPISLMKKEMNYLCEKLPILQKEMEKLMKSIDDHPLADKESKIDSPIKKKIILFDDEEEPSPPKAQNKENCYLDEKESDHQFSDKKPLEDKVWKFFLISNYKQYETKLYLSTYEQKPYIWLRLYFDANHDLKATEIKKRKKKDMKPCRGGIILNDVNSDNLIQFVKNM